MMDTRTCAEVRAYLLDAAHSAGGAPPSPALVRHVAGCPGCQGALMVLLAELLGGTPRVEPILCDAAERDLPAYVDIELEEGTLEAMRAFPALAWHLWTCAGCAETYRLLLAAAQAERAGLASLATRSASATSSSALVLAEVRLQPAVVARALPRYRPALGALRGDGPSHAVLFESEAGDYELQLRVAPLGATDWELELHVSPGVDGWLLLSAPGATWRAPLVAGAARLAPLPLALLERTAPDLVCEVTARQQRAVDTVGDPPG